MKRKRQQTKPKDRPSETLRPDLTIEELLRGLPDGPLVYEDLPEFIPIGRERVP